MILNVNGQLSYKLLRGGMECMYDFDYLVKPRMSIIALQSIGDIFMCCAILKNVSHAIPLKNLSIFGGHTFLNSIEKMYFCVFSTR